MAFCHPSEGFDHVGSTLLDGVPLAAVAAGEDHYCFHVFKNLVSLVLSFFTVCVGKLLDDTAAVVVDGKADELLHRHRIVQADTVALAELLTPELA